MNWRSIELAPRDGTTVDLFQNGERVTDAFWSDIQEWWCIEDKEWGREEPIPLAIGPKPTHWMPLPKRPEG